jgi:hypothetical protein
MPTVNKMPKKERKEKKKSSLLNIVKKSFRASYILVEEH